MFGELICPVIYTRAQGVIHGRNRMRKRITLPITDMAQSLRFYRAALAPLGFRLLQEPVGRLTCALQEQPELWLVASATRPHPRLAVTLDAEDRDAVRQFFQAAMMAGGLDRRAPALYPECHREDYSALILDPDQHCIKVVCHISE